MLEEMCARVRAGRVREGMAELLALHSQSLRPDSTLELGDEDRAILVATLVDCRLARGDLAEAMVLGDELTALASGPGLAGAIAHHAKGELASALGDPELALDHYLAAGLLAPEASPDLLPWRCGAALAQLRVGNRTGAAELARTQVALVSADPTPYAEALALRTLATVDVSVDRVGTLRLAKALVPGATAERLAAQIDTDLAGLLLLLAPVDGAEEALELLRAAEDHAGRQELWPLQGRVRRLLDRLGEPPRRVQSEAMAALTVAERRVARLAADGLTNRQIAQELVVTIKAVEWHLSHVYRKLGIRSRTRLASTLGVAV